MSQESETESRTDLDSSSYNEELTMVNSEDVFGTEIIPSGLGDPRERTLQSLSENALLAVQKLYDVVSDLDGLLLDEATVWDLEVFFTDILLFIKAGADRQLLECEDQCYMTCIVSIFDISFLRILFGIRRRLLQIIPGSGSGDTDETGVCWVDFFFACFTDFITSIASREQNNANHVSFRLQDQREEESLRVACQLPHSFEHLPELLQSKHASPASKRLTLSILFAAFVIRPDLEECDPWMEAELRPECLLECLQDLLEEFLAQARELALFDNSPARCFLLTSYAMGISLFASGEAAIQRREDQNSFLPFQPHTSASLLELLHFILLTPSSKLTATAVCGELTDAQSFLTSWGTTVPWAWQKWDDPRVIGFDTVVTLTSNWLCHLDEIIRWKYSYLQADGSMSSTSSDSKNILRCAILSNPRASLVTLFNQVRDESTRGCISQIAVEFNLKRLQRTISCLVILIEGCHEALSPDDQLLVVEQLVWLFIELEESTGMMGSQGTLLKWKASPASDTVKVKAEVILFLNSLNSVIVEKAFLCFHKNITFFTKIAGVIGKVNRMIIGDPTGHFSFEPGLALELVTLLDFISVICKCNAAKCIPVSAFSLLSDFVKFLSRCIGTPALRVALLNCLVYAHVQCRSTRSGTGQAKDSVTVDLECNKSSTSAKPHQTWEDEDVYNLVLDLSGTNLDLAAAFASYVSLTIKRNTDPLLTAETWDYLHDVLLLIASGRLAECDDGFGQPGLASASILLSDETSTPEPPSESDRERKTRKFVDATEKICSALEAVLKRSDAAVARLLLESPMTISLYDALRKLTDSETTRDGGRPHDRNTPSAADGSASTGRGSNFQGLGIEEGLRLDPRVVQTCEKFLEKLKKIDAELAKEA